VRDSNGDAAAIVESGMEGIAGEAAHTRRLSTGRPHGAGGFIADEG
jgi:hypothetical protein